MAAKRTRFTTDQVFSYFFTENSSSEDVENVDETFTEYVGIALSDSYEESTDTDLLSTDRTSANEDSDDCGPISSPKPVQTGCGTTSLLIQDATPDPVVESADTSTDSDEFVISDFDLDESNSGSQVSGSNDNNESTSVQSAQGSDSEVERRGQARGRGRARGRRGQSRGYGRGYRLSGRSQHRAQGRVGTFGIRGSRTSGRQQPTSYTELIPEQAKSISEVDPGFSEWSDFQPLRESGPYLPFPEDHDPTELELFQLFITDDIFDRFVQATNSYAG